MHFSKTIILAATAAVISTGALSAQEDAKLTGTVMGTLYSVDYNNGGAASTTVNSAKCAFDGNLNTYFASYERSFTWVGLDLGEPHVITRVGYAARNDSHGPDRVRLAVIQGANQPDFSDAMPIHIITNTGVIGRVLYDNVNNSKGYRYVRYVGPHDARCNVAEVEFYGHPGEGTDDGLYQPTNLPLVVVNTPNMEWFHDNDKSYEMNGSLITIVDGGKINIQAPGQIRGRGNFSWLLPKKPFRIKFDKKQQPLDATAKAKKWTMVNYYGDKALMRGLLGFEISRRMGMAYTPYARDVDLIFNGEYQGTYQFGDQIEVNKNRVNITEMEPTDTEGKALTGGYLIEVDAYAHNEPADEYFDSKYHSIPVTIKSPDPGVPEQYNYIRDRFSDMEKTVLSVKRNDPETGYKTKLDLDSFIKYLLISEVVGNTDAFWSTYMTLDRGADKFVVGPVWDLELGFDNDSRIYPVCSHGDFVCFWGSWASNTMKDFVHDIVKLDPFAKERIKYLWSYARKYRGIDEDELCAIIDKWEQDFKASAALNFKRWDILGVKVHQNPQVLYTYHAEVANVKRYINERLTNLDKLIGLVEVSESEDYLPEVSLSAPADFMAVPGNGYIEVGGSAAFSVYSTQGALMGAGEGQDRVAVPQGIYVVRDNASGATLKVAVK